MATDAGIEAKRVAGALTSMRIDELISHLAIGIATGQTELDKACMEIARFMGEARIAFGKKPGRDQPDELSLIELGFTPNFYQFVDSILEVKVAISSQYEQTYEYETNRTSGSVQTSSGQQAREGSTQGNVRGTNLAIGSGNVSVAQYMADYNAKSSSSSSYSSKRLSVTTVDAKYSSTYNYAVEGSSTIKTKIVPVPVPPVYEERVRAMVQQMREREEWLTSLYEIKAAIPSVVTEAQRIGGDAAFPGENFGTPEALLALTVDDGNRETEVTHARATALETELNKLSERYAAIGDEHWAVVGSAADRDASNRIVNGINTAMGQLLAAFGGDPIALRSAAEVASATLQARIDDIKGGLLKLRNKMTEILAALPLTPEEEEEEEAEKQNGGSQ